MTFTLKVRGPGENKEGSTHIIKPGGSWDGNAEHRVVVQFQEGLLKLLNSGGTPFVEFDSAKKTLTLDLYNIPCVRLPDLKRKRDDPEEEMPPPKKSFDSYFVKKK